MSSAASIACPSYPRRRVPSEHGLHHLVGNVYPQFRAGAQLHDFTVDLDRHLLEVGELVLAKTGPRPRTAALTSAASRARSRACPACPVPCNITVRPGCRRASSSLSSAASPEAFPVLLGLKIRTTRSKGCIRSPYGHRGGCLPTFRQARLPESWAAPPPVAQHLRRTSVSAVGGTAKRVTCRRGTYEQRSLSVVVLASADGAAHGAQDPEDHADNDQEAADGLQNGDCRDQSDDHKHDSENDQLRFLPCS